MPPRCWFIAPPGNTTSPSKTFRARRRLPSCSRPRRRLRSSTRRCRYLADSASFAARQLNACFGTRGRFAFSMERARFSSLSSPETYCRTDKRFHRSRASSGTRHRHVGVDFVALGLRLRLVFVAQIFHRALRQIRHRQEHRSDETRRPVGRLREYRLWTGFEPWTAGAVRGRAAMGVDADATLEQTADARPQMAVQIGTAAWREGDPVTPH